LSIINFASKVITVPTWIPNFSTSSFVCAQTSIERFETSSSGSLPGWRVWIAGRQKIPVTGPFFVQIFTLILGAI